MRYDHFNLTALTKVELNNELINPIFELLTLKIFIAQAKINSPSHKKTVKDSKKDYVK